MEHTARFEEQFAIVAETERPELPLRVLKHGDSFGVFDHYGNIGPSDASEEGLYHGGTRFLSQFELLMFRRRPLFLSSTISADNALFVADLTNPDVRAGDDIVIPRGQIHLVRARVLWEGRCFERWRISNYAETAVDVPLAIRFDADFADVFEVRGTRRPRRGDRLPDATENGSYLMRYRGLDGVERRARIRYSTPPDTIGSGLLTYKLHLSAGACASLDFDVTAEVAGERRQKAGFDEALRLARTRLLSQTQGTCSIISSNDDFNRWVSRSLADLQMMMTDTPYGLYPYAGIPWFSTPFGRDGLLTAFEVLWASPQVARGVLAFLANTQATAASGDQDAEPGKIVHEIRSGEMAALGEVPFGRYYGSADSTPLFVMLAHAYYERTGDREFIDRLWPNIVAALEWMATSGDPDGDGFIEYARRSESGLIQQGWKDSHDSVFHADGSSAEPPIALCEVQGYAYGAWTSAAELASLRGDARGADQWRRRAEQLRARFEGAFWCESLGTYALALDGQKRRCQIRTSNPGHCLFAGIASRERAANVRASLMDDRHFAGWGVRTVAAGERRYNPMSYHNGSIWPHDNAIVAAGLSRYGHTDAAMRITTAMFQLSQVVDLHRLPELICGFHRRADEHPTLYPVACAPQAWAAAAVYLLLQSCLGLTISAPEKRVSLTRPQLPPDIDWVQLANLTIGSARLDLRLERHRHDVGVIVQRREGEVDVVAVK